MRLRNRFLAPTKAPHRPEITVIIYGSSAQGIEGIRSRPPVSMTALEGNYSVLDSQLDSIFTVFRSADVILVGGYEFQRMSNHKPAYVRLVHNQKYNDSGEIEDIRLAANCCVTDDVIIISSNILFDSQALKSLKGNKSGILVESKSKVKDSLGVISNGGKIESMCFGVGNLAYNFMFLQSKEFLALKKFSAIPANKNLFIFEAINYIISGTSIIRAVENKGFIKEINHHKDLQF